MEHMQGDADARGVRCVLGPHRGLVGRPRMGPMGDRGPRGRAVDRVHRLWPADFVTGEPMVEVGWRIAASTGGRLRDGGSPRSAALRVRGARARRDRLVHGPAERAIVAGDGAYWPAPRPVRRLRQPQGGRRRVPAHRAPHFSTDSDEQTGRAPATARWARARGPVATTTVRCSGSKSGPSSIQATTMVSVVRIAPAGRPRGHRSGSIARSSASTSPRRMIGPAANRSQLSQSTAVWPGSAASDASPALGSCQIAPSSQVSPPSVDDSTLIWTLSPPKIVVSPIDPPVDGGRPWGQ